ncbi:MAG TPA: PepSY domain-containing protein [Limnobacter sp.]|nr:PepSY domain-containing protein [Limnobacter sp.]
MIRRPAPTLITAAILLFVGLPMTAMANGDHNRDTDLVKAFGLISAEQAKTLALKEAPGVVTELELDDRDFAKGWKWEVEVVNAEGKEVEVDLDAKTGQVLKVDKDWF